MELFCPIFCILLPDNNRCSCKERHLKKKGSEMDTNELKQRQHFILIRTLLVVTALALLVYIAFSMAYSSRRFQESTSIIEWVND